MSTKPKTNSFSIYLLKEGYSSYGDLVIDGVKGPVSVGDGVLYYSTTEDHTIPAWVSNFFGNEIKEEIKKTLNIKSVSAVYLTCLTIEEKKVTFAITFGFGRYLLKCDRIQRDFGLITSKHAVEVDQIKSMSAFTYDGNIKVKTIESVNEITENEFFLNSDTDILKKVNGRVRKMDDADLISERLIGGKDSVIMTAKVDYSNINLLLSQLYKQYQDNGENGVRYTSSITKIKDEKTISEIDTLLMEALQDDEKKKHVYLSFPLTESNDTRCYLKYKVGGVEYKDLSIDILSSFSGIETIRTSSVLAYIDDEKDPDNQPLFKCIYAELEKEDRCYLLAEGEVYRVEKTYKETVERAYRDAKIDDTLILNDWTGSYDEDKFNRDQLSENILVMDKEFVYPAGRSKIEICDLLSRDKKFIHVKIYNGASAPLGHLFNQGLISAKSVFDDSLRGRINEKISSVHEKYINEGKLMSGIDFHLDDPFDARQYTVVFLMLCMEDRNVDAQGRPLIPFFAKAVFKDVSQAITNLGFKVRIAGMKSTKTTP